MFWLEGTSAKMINKNAFKKIWRFTCFSSSSTKIATCFERVMNTDWKVKLGVRYISSEKDLSTDISLPEVMCGLKEPHTRHTHIAIKKRFAWAVAAWHQFFRLSYHKWSSQWIVNRETPLTAWYCNVERETVPYTTVIVSSTFLKQLVKSSFHDLIERYKT